MSSIWDIFGVGDDQEEDLVVELSQLERENRILDSACNELRRAIARLQEQLKLQSI